MKVRPRQSPYREINQLNTATMRSRLIKLAGTVAGHSAVALIDSGATGLFVSSSFVARHSLPLAKAAADTQITLADGHRQQAAGVLSSVPVVFSSYTDRLDFTVTDLLGYDVILGMEWLERHNPAIDWRGSSVSFVDPQGCEHVLRCVRTGLAPWRASPKPSPPARLNLMSGNVLKHHLRRGAVEYVYMVYVDADGSIRVPPEKLVGTVRPPHQICSVSVGGGRRLASLLALFRDVFPADLPNGLPPSRDVDHRIELVPGAVPPSRPTYRLSSHRAGRAEEAAGRVDQGRLHPAE